MDIKDYLINFYKESNGETITPELAEILVHDFAVTDGTDRDDGEKWTMEECTNAGTNVGVDWTRIMKSEWYLVLNMLYSDYFLICKKYNVPESQFFVDMALCWFNDVDGKDNKTFRYFFC